MKTFRVVSQLVRSRIISMLKEGSRIDDRGLLDYRPIDVKCGLISRANGSAQVSIGSTKVLAGVKVGIGEPFSDVPDQGVLAVNAELVPLASPAFEPGPPDETAIELARVIDRTLRETKTIDLKSLCIEPGRRVFVVFLDIYVLDHDGNFIDASALASILALLNTRIRKFSIDEGELRYEEEYVPLPVLHTPVTITLAKPDDGPFIVDPNLEEELSLDNRVCISVDELGRICAIQKLDGSLSVDEVFEVVSIACKTAPKLIEIVRRESGLDAGS
ncbi:MAG: RNA-binding protein [Candidatus Bathyarchaeota archaeon B24]|nr:MAG: RNA-binding protein [Candidatus Bathyarchaeota archaeon B24]